MSENKVSNGVSTEELILSNAAVRILEPMCVATERLLQPPSLWPTDVLFLWMDADGRRFIADLRALKNDSGKMLDTTESYPGVSHAASSFFLRVPERKSLNHKQQWDYRFRWRLAATDFTALVTHHCWPFAQIQFRPPGLNDDGSWQFPEDEEAKQKYRYLLARFLAQTDRARKIAAFKERREMPPKLDHWVSKDGMSLADYQEICVQLQQHYDSLAIFFDRGCGKTAIAIQAVCHDARLSRMAGSGMIRVLCVVPQQARKNWEVEFERFATVKGKVTVLRGGLIKRISALHRVVSSEDDLAFSVGIVGYDGARNTVDQLSRIPWDILIFDESHKFKSSSTKRWKSCIKLRDASKKVLIMTGTPIGNTPFDLWAQLEAMGQGLSGFETYQGFKTFHGQFRNSAQGHGIEKLVAIQNVPLLQERLARISFSMTKEEAGLKLPEKVYDFWEVTMTKQQAELYDRVANELRVEIEEQLADNPSSITVENVLVRLLRLAQITSGHVGFDPLVDEDTGEIKVARRTEQISWPNPKVEAVVQMLTDEERDPLGKTLIWCNFIPDIVAISKRLQELGIDHVTYYGGVSQDQREERERRFNWDPSCKVMVCNPQTAGEALNLVGYDWNNPDSPQEKTYTDHEIFFSCNWSALQRDQAEDRGHRRGMRAPNLRITDLIVPNTIDEEIRTRLRAKKDMARLVMDIREVLRAVFGDRNDDEEEEGEDE